MYHCCIRFYLIGKQHKAFETIKGMAPLENFTHEFYESETPERDYTAGSDVIFADIEGMDPEETIKLLLETKRQDAELILLAGKSQIAEISDCLPGIKDVWTSPLDQEEVRFRFLRWQERFKTEKDSWQISQYLNAVINGSPNLIWFKTKAGIHEKVNDSFCRTVCKAKEDVEGWGHAYIWDVEQDDPACIASEHEVMNQKKTFIFDETIKVKNGTRLLTTYKSPLYDCDGSVMGTVGVAIDVTRERAYQEEITSKTRALETIFTTMDCGVMYHTLDGSNIIRINRAALQILGYETKEEMLADGFSTVAMSVLDEDKPKLHSAIQALKKTEESTNVEYRVRHKDGKILHIIGNIKLVEENGELFYQRFLLDCTAQKLQEEQERSEKERLHTDLIHALSVDYNMVSFFDMDTGKGKLLQLAENISPAAAAIFRSEKITFQESMEQYISQLVHKEDQEMLRQTCSKENLLHELSSQKTYYITFRTCIDGEIFYYQIKAVRAGLWAKRRGIVLGIRNVDAATRKEIEKKELLEDALLQANNANKAKSVFLSNMSHDIRTPMNAILGFANLAIIHIEQKEQVKEYLKKILTSGNHLVSLINDVLDMSRIESGKMHLEEQLCSLPDILHGLRSIVQADVQAKQLELHIDAVDVWDEEVYCDKLRLNQLLLNLLSNSIKYTGSGGTVSMKIFEKPGAPEGYANYEFHIIDNGIGMSREFIERIFEPFERERNSTISGIQGTGLGMAITKNIVDMMKGTIQVKSEPNAGTEFIISLTFRLSTKPKPSHTILKLQNCRALVVDDDFTTCDSVSFMLQQIGMRAEWTLSAKEAILRTRQAVMREDLYSVYIIDWIMPDMNGIEAARRIQKEVQGKAPIIILTAYDWSDMEEEAREAGVSGFCSKPLFLSELNRCLLSVIDSNPASLPQVTKSSLNKSHSGRILLAEDNLLNQEIATVILQEAGFTAEVADNGQIAVNMLQNSEPGYFNLVLMDVQMPVMDGYEATKAIRSFENKELAGIPIFAMTANAFEEDRRQAIQSGMNGHISKPINIEKLIETLDTVLK